MIVTSSLDEELSMSMDKELSSSMSKLEIEETQRPPPPFGHLESIHESSEHDSDDADSEENETVINLITNHYKFETDSSFDLYQHIVSNLGPSPSPSILKAFEVALNKYGVELHLFDNKQYLYFNDKLGVLKSPHRIPVVIEEETNTTKIIQIRYLRKLDPSSAIYEHFYNEVLLSRILKGMEFDTSGNSGRTAGLVGGEVDGGDDADAKARSVTLLANYKNHSAMLCFNPLGCQHNDKDEAGSSGSSQKAVFDVGMNGEKRIEEIRKFRQRLSAATDILHKLNAWGGFKIGEELVNVTARILPRVDLQFSTEFHHPHNPSPAPRIKKIFRLGHKLHQDPNPFSLTKWVIIAPNWLDPTEFWHSIMAMVDIAKIMRFTILYPENVLTVACRQEVVRPYFEAITKVIRTRIQYELYFIVLPENDANIISLMTRKLSVQHGVLSQLYLAKDFMNLSPPTKEARMLVKQLVTTITAKLGVEPWNLGVSESDSLKKMMIIGFDIGDEIGATVASINSNFTKYFNTTCQVNRTCRETGLGQILKHQILKCLDAYKAANEYQLPETIIFYHCPGEKLNLKDITNTTVGLVREFLKDTVNQLHDNFSDSEPPKLAFILVTKKPHVRFFMPETYETPPAGTLIEETFTFDGQNDFYLNSTNNPNANNDNSPVTHYNILHNSTDQSTKELQEITYKLCYLYFGWGGSKGICIPAPCRYAADLISNSINNFHSHDSLSTKLHYLNLP